MTDQDFRNRIFETLSRMESQRKEDNERLEKRLEAMETQRKEDNERLEKRLEAMEAQRKKDNERLEKRLDSLNARVGAVERDVGWIKGKLEGKQESNRKILPIFSTGTAIAAVIIALIALFN